MLYIGLGQCIIALYLLYQYKEYIHKSLNFKMLAENKDIVDKKEMKYSSKWKLCPPDSVMSRKVD